MNEVQKDFQVFQTGNDGVAQAEHRENSLEKRNSFRKKESSAHGKKLHVVISRGLLKGMNSKTFCEKRDWANILKNQSKKFRFCLAGKNKSFKAFRKGMIRLGSLECKIAWHQERLELETTQKAIASVQRTDIKA